jgi:Asp/Glu/hydantoin racemase
MRIGFIHTVGFLVESFRQRAAAELAGADCFHILNESLLQDLLRGAPQPLVWRRVVAQIVLAAEAGADLLVVTCSSTSPAVDLARPLLTQPVLKIDDPMMAAAARLGGRIGLVCTATSTVEPSSALLAAHAAASGRHVDIIPCIEAEAYKALMAGDRDRHDALVLAAARRLAADVDALVLAQASLARLQAPLAADTGKPVLASPDLLMAEIKTRLGGI